MEKQVLCLCFVQQYTRQENSHYLTWECAREFFLLLNQNNEMVEEENM